MLAANCGIFLPDVRLPLVSLLGKFLIFLGQALTIEGGLGPVSLVDGLRNWASRDTLSLPLWAGPLVVVGRWTFLLASALLFLGPSVWASSALLLVVVTHATWACSQTAHGTAFS